MTVAIFGLRQPPSSVRRIKIFGERNTGTNYVEALLAANLDSAICPGNLSEKRRLLYKLLEKTLPYHFAWKMVETDRDNQYLRRFDQELGWKHARIPNLPTGVQSYPSGTGFVAVVKNPYSWLLSLHKRPYQNEHLRSLSFQEFIRHPWTTVGRECSDTAAYPTPVHLWNDKAGSYTALGMWAPVVVARYEDILRSPIVFLHDVAAAFDLRCRSNPVLPRSSTKNDGRTSADIAAYYLEERWRHKLTAPDICYINEILDPRLMSDLEYPMLTAIGGTKTSGFEMPGLASSRPAAVPSRSGGAGLEHHIAS